MAGPSILELQVLPGPDGSWFVRGPWQSGTMEGLHNPLTDPTAD